MQNIISDVRLTTLQLRRCGKPAEALAHTKRLINDSLGASPAEQRAFAAAGVNPDFDEGLAAFFEKRPARFNVD